MRKLPLSLAAVFALLAMTASSYAKQVITINVYFDTNGTRRYGLSGNDGTFFAARSDLDADQRKAVLAEAQAEFDAAKINQDCRYVFQAVEGNPPNEPAKVANNTINMVVTGATFGNGLSFGNAGLPGRPGVVAAGTFRIDPDYAKNGKLTDGGLKAIGQTLAHEVGHKLGLQHNQDDPASKMTEGTRVSAAARQQDRPFNAGDVERLKAILMRDKPMTPGQYEQPNGAGNREDLGVRVGQVQIPSTFGPTDAMYLNATARFTGPADLTFGYMSFADLFVPVGDLTTAAPDDLVTFIENGGMNLAVQDSNGRDFTLEGGYGTYQLSVPNPLSPRLDEVATVHFNAPDGAATLVLRADSGANDYPSTGGFRNNVVPEPSTFCLCVSAFLCGAVYYVRRKRRPPTAAV